MHHVVNLHAHENTASGDSSTPATEMADRYATADPPAALVGLVGHDARPTVTPNPDGSTSVITGIEHETRADNGNRLHVVEYPDHDFRFLAHPRLTWPDSPREKARQFARENDIDAVERLNRGKWQYSGSLGVPEIGNDDAHNTHQVGSSYTVVEADAGDPQTLLDAIRNGETMLANRGARLDEQLAGRLHQGINLARERF